MKEDIASARSLKELPENARRYVAFLEEHAGCPIVLVSVGFRRDDTIVLGNPFLAPPRARFGARAV